MDVQTVMEDPRFGVSRPSRGTWHTWRQSWVGNVRADVLAGLVVAFALVPESIAFSFIAGVDPKVGLYASVLIAMTIAFAGGRPAMISASTGATALVMGSLVRDHGFAYLTVATLLAGGVQLVFAWQKLARYMRFVPRPVMVGFVNALAILVFLAQLPALAGGGVQAWAFVAGGLALIYLVPRLTRAVPSALVAIIALTLVSVTSLGAGLRRVGDMGRLPTAPPTFTPFHVPLTLETLRIVLPVSLALALVGLVESLLTASILDEMTDTTSDKNVEARGQGIANIVSGLFGGMAGCAMIGQSVINVKAGGRGRLSTFTAGAALLVLMLAASTWLRLIPLSALVAVMFTVCIGTVDWRALRTLHRAPRGETLVMLVTVATVVATHDLAEGVVVGVLLSALLFTRRVAGDAAMQSTRSADGRTRTYAPTGQLFFVTVTSFLAAFDFQEAVERVVIDLGRAHVWDGSAVAAIDTVVLRFRARGVRVDVVGANEASATLLERLATHNKPDALAPAAG